MAHFKLRQCKNPDCSNEFKQYNSLQSYCTPACKIAHDKPKKIKQVSDKRKAEQIVYSELRRLFLLKHPKCPITGEPTTDVHHMRGRVGSLYLDTRYWLAVSRDGHQKIELNPEWAKKMGYSLERLTK